MSSCRGFKLVKLGFLVLDTINEFNRKCFNTRIPENSSYFQYNFCAESVQGLPVILPRDRLTLFVL